MAINGEFQGTRKGGEVRKILLLLHAQNIWDLIISLHIGYLDQGFIVVLSHARQRMHSFILNSQRSLPSTCHQTPTWRRWYKKEKL